MSLDPTLAGQDRQDLATALRRLRKAARLSGEQLAERCHMSQSKISRIETGRLLPSVVDVDLIVTAVCADPAMKSELLGLARVANSEYQDVRASVRRGLHHRQREIASLESEAAHVCHFLPAMITGLLQVPEYVRAALNRPTRAAKGDTSQTVALKLERQAILHDESKRFDFLLTEQAVRWLYCDPSVMATQMDRLVSVSKLPNVRIGILPGAARVQQGPMHTFVVYDARLVTVELFTGRLVLRDPKDIEHYRMLFEFFSGHALWGDQAREFLAGVGEDFRRMR